MSAAQQPGLPPATFDPATFNPAAYDRLVPTSMDFDLGSGELTFGYELRGPDAGRDIPLCFTEKLILPVPGALAPGQAAALSAILHLAHVAAGVSYAKAAAVTTVEAGELTAAELAFITGVYRDGMAEFAYINDIPAVLSTTVAATVVPDEQLPFTWDAAAPLIACGGGKDSIVSLEALRRAGMDVRSFVVNPNAITTAVATRAQAPLLTVRRQLDPLLFALNAAGAYNGHVPVTALNSLLGVAVSLLHGLGPLVMSNESSASVPNLTWHGHEVNHQWSKGIAAERLLRAALASRLSSRLSTDGSGDGLTGKHTGAELYFSLLRELNEASIAALFARVTGYDDVITSCNRAFTITKNHGTRWCRDCPKCRFVFLALAAFMPRERLVGIFGGDLLSDASQLDGYRELLGLKDFKPFECVGELEESAALAAHIGADPQWRDAVVLGRLNDELRASARPVPALAAVLAQRSPTLAPARYREVLDALC